MSPEQEVPRPSAPPPDSEWFRDLAASGHDVFFRYRLLPSPGYDYLSPSVTELTGYPVEAFLADPTLFRNLVHPDDRALLDLALGGAADASTIRWLRMQALIVGLGHFSRTIGHTIIAEGIETRAERATLTALDIHYGQGYLLGRPAEVSAWKLPAGRGPR